MRVRIPTLLRSYTDGKKEVVIEADTLFDVLNELEKQFPGIKFRFINEQEEIREHMKIFVNQVEVKDLQRKMRSDDDVFIIQALSGG
ncbi:MAG: MoaD/ThiS family protein [Candidatus Kariarchaeaceae archaeon]|jgi:molybdopterin converting factor small subunit